MANPLQPITPACTNSICRERCATALSMSWQSHAKTCSSVAAAKAGDPSRLTR
jgi:hypothetical protein